MKTKTKVFLDETKRGDFRVKFVLRTPHAGFAVDTYAKLNAMASDVESCHREGSVCLTDTFVLTGRTDSGKNQSFVSCERLVNVMLELSPSRQCLSDIVRGLDNGGEYSFTINQSRISAIQAAALLEPYFVFHCV